MSLKRIFGCILSAAVISSVAVIPVRAAGTSNVVINRETLDRGLVAIQAENGVYLSWRLFDGEDARFGSADSNVSFNIYRNGGTSPIATVTDSTNYTDETVGTSYSVAPVINGVEGDKCKEISVWDNNYIDINLEKPEPETIYDNSGNVVYENISFSPADCSTGDLDGDGEYEIIVKWTSSEHDVGSPGAPSYSGTVRLAAYKLDGTKMWNNDINLGKNVYSSAHTVQFLVYDFDLDGKSEVMCQTSLGSTDAAGAYVSRAAKADSVVASTSAKIAEFTDEQNAEADYRNAGWGLITTGEEFLTVFNGETGEAIDTIDLPTARGNAIDWGDANNTAGNRVNRFVADVAYLDGEKPYAVYLRGYYFGKDNNGRQRTSIAGISFDGESLSPDYRFDTKSGQPGYYDGAYQYVGQGNHNCTVADVDNDGKDEFITGALCMEVDDNNDFKPRWCTYLQHGDALHIGDYDPTHSGFEFFTVHEDSGENTLSGETITMDYGMSVIDANTGELLFHEGGSGDTGRGVMANIGMGGFYQIWSSKNELRMSDGGTNYTLGSKEGLFQNFRIFWDGDLYDELLDGTSIMSWNGSSMASIFDASNYGCVEINGSKANPALQADLFGDWREEVVYPTTDGAKLRVFTTTIKTDYKIKTLMQDPVYRSGVAAEQTAYNQPPHIGFYLAEELFAPDVDSLTVDASNAKATYVLGESLSREGLVVTANYIDGTSDNVNAYSLSGLDSSTPGAQTITVTYRGATAEFTVNVKEVTAVRVVSPPANTTVYKGGTLDITGLVVSAAYNDGTEEIITDYELSDCDSGALGTQTITVTYQGRTATFEITVLPASISALNRTYETDGTNSVLTTLPIGIYSGGFTIEHTVTINSLPADGSSDKNSTAGFFMRFMNLGATTHIGGGWYLTASGSQAQVIWKNTKTQTVGKINIGETYTFKYEFSNVGTGSGAALTLSILDSSGNVVASQSGLNVRNFTDTELGIRASITAVEVYNQAKSGSKSSIIFDNAKVYGNGEIISVDGANITASVSSVNILALYAAKYDDEGALENVQVLTPSAAGETTFSASFVPDKVFLWSEMTPIDYWSGEN